MNFSPAQIEADEIFELNGDVPAEALALVEPAAKAEVPVHAELQVQKDEGNFIVTGRLQTTLSLLCGRCAVWFPLKVNVRVEHLFEAPHPNCIDLTPLIREDILLELPLNAACRLGADGRCPITGEVYQPRPENSGSLLAGETVWEALDKIKPKN